MPRTNGGLAGSGAGILRGGGVLIELLVGPACSPQHFLFLIVFQLLMMLMLLVSHHLQRLERGGEHVSLLDSC